MTKHNTHDHSDHKHEHHDHKDHDHKNHETAEKPKNNNMFMGVIIALLVVISVMGFFLGRMTVVDPNAAQTSGSYEDLEITVISDQRDASIPIADVISQIQGLPSIAGITITEKEFGDDGVKELLKENSISALPVIMFSTNNFDTAADPLQYDQAGKASPKINAFLQKLPKDGYFLPIQASFNPFAERSARGKLILEAGVLEKILADSYIKGNKDAEMLWLEYSDMECPYCGKLHNDGTLTQAMDKYKDSLALVYNHFPLNFHPNAQKAAEALECIGEQKGADMMYKQIEDSYAKYFQNNFSFDGFYEIAEANGINVANIKSCVEAGTFATKVTDQQAFGAKNFGVTGTPGNVFINTKTGEYEVVSGAIPFASADAAIAGLLSVK